MKNKYLGMLLGLHAGDSLGATLEFKSPSEKIDSHKDIIGGGAFGWNAGDPTDDTDMMLCILRSISEHKSFKIGDIASRFIHWMESGPKDIGATTAMGIRGLKNNEEPKELGERGQGNGSLMRCAPMATFNQTPLLETQTMLTHNHPVPIDCDASFLKALRYLVTEKPTSKKVAMSRIETLLSSDLYEEWKKRKYLPWECVKSSGWCIDTLMIALWVFHHTESFEEAICACVNRGGDADTAGAVAGALCGAFYGVEAIPERWLRVLKKKSEIEELVEEMFDY